MKLRFIHLAVFLAQSQPSLQQRQTPVRNSKTRRRTNTNVFSHSTTTSSKGGKGAPVGCAPTPAPAKGSKGTKYTRSPSCSTTSAPTAPTLCQDNPNTFYVPNTGGTGMRTCDWVNRKPGNQEYPWRCRYYPEAAENCRVSCGTCPSDSSSPTASPTKAPTSSPRTVSPTKEAPASSPSASPTISAPTPCGDNPNTFYVEGTAGNGMRSCDWVNRNPGNQEYPWKCREYPEAAENCMASCGLCLSPTAAPTSSPTAAPTSSPTAVPTSSPTVSAGSCAYDTINCDTVDGSCNRVDRSGVVSGPVGSTSCADLTSAQLTSFTPIGGTAGSEILDISCAAHTSETVDLGFDFQWLGASSAMVSSIFVDTNGQIKLNPADNISYNCGNNGFLGDHGYPRIAVATGDYHPVTFGDIVVCKSTHSVVVSFEEMDLYGANTSSTVNAQAQLFADGRVVICFGESPFGTTVTSSCVNNIVSGIEGGVNDPTYPSGPAVEYNVPDVVFDASSGAATIWPDSGKCYLFEPRSAGFVAV